MLAETGADGRLTRRGLAEAGRQRQIIVFTHHQHVADLAAAIDGHAIDVMRL